MNGLERIRTLSSGENFTLFEAYDKKLGLPMVLKQCPCSKVSEIEFYIRSALTSTRDNLYSQPLLSIFASADRTAEKTFINFVWRRGKVLDPEVEQDHNAEFPSGSEGYGKAKRLFTNSRINAYIEHVRCLTLGRKVMRKVFNYRNLLDMNYILQEALLLAKCRHPNVCDFLDFQLFQKENGYHCAYIVTELPEYDIEREIRKRKSKSEPLSEAELTVILQDITAALLHAKAQGIAHRDIKPSNIFRTSHRFKISGFDNTLEKVIYEDTSSSSQFYMSPEAIRAVSSLVEGIFESDVYSLGLTILHLAALELPAKKGIMSKWHELLCSTVQDLTFSEGFKQLLMGMVNTEPSRRPTLESVRDEAANLFYQASRNSAHEALRLKELITSNLTDGNYERAEKLCAAANAIYSSSSTKDKEIALNYRNWAISLSFLKKYEEAATQFAAADTILSSFYPNDMDMAINLTKYGCLLLELGKNIEAISNYKAANTILSKLFPHEKDTAVNYTAWGNALSRLEKDAEAIRNYEAADAILSRLFPHEKETAINYTNWGKALSGLGKNTDAIKNYEAAYEIYFQHFPNEEETAINYTNWGKALHEIGKRAEAITKFAAADTIFAQYFPDEKCTADNLHDWGIALKKTGNYSEAVLKYTAAGAIYSLISPNTGVTAINLLTWGTALKNMNNREEARTKFGEASALFFRMFYGAQGANTQVNSSHLSEMIIKKVRDCPNLADIYQIDLDRKSNAHNLHYWGIALKKIGNSWEAVNKYRAANIIYSHFFPDEISTAINFHNWGNALLKIRSIQEAVEKYKSADAIFTRLSYKGIVCADNLRKMADLIDFNKQTAAISFQAFSLLSYAEAIYEGRLGITDYLPDMNKRYNEEFEAAGAIYSLFPDDIGNAINHMKWGIHLKRLKYRERAVAQLKLADRIFAHYYPNHFSCAENLYYLAFASQEMEKNEEAIRKLEAARAIFVLGGEHYEVCEIDQKIENLEKLSANP